MDTSFVEAFLCSGCGTAYRTRSGLRKNKIFKQTESQPFKCCGKSYVERSSFEAHQRAQHDKTKLECDKRKKTFTRKSALKRHMKSHVQSEKKHFTCSICKCEFLRKDELTDHVKGVHERAKRFSCPSCSMRFAWRASLHRHISKAHHDSFIRYIQKYYRCF